MYLIIIWLTYYREQFAEINTGFDSSKTVRPFKFLFFSMFPALFIRPIKYF